MPFCSEMVCLVTAHEPHYIMSCRVNSAGISFDLQLLNGSSIRLFFGPNTDTVLFCEGMRNVNAGEQSMMPLVLYDALGNAEWDLVALVPVQNDSGPPHTCEISMMPISRSWMSNTFSPSWSEISYDSPALQGERTMDGSISRIIATTTDSRKVRIDLSTTTPTACAPPYNSAPRSARPNCPAKTLRLPDAVLDAASARRVDFAYVRRLRRHHAGKDRRRAKAAARLAIAADEAAPETG